MLELKIGEFFAGCRILCICGTGGFGTVYLAENAAGRRVALKIVSSANQEKELRGIRLYMDSAAQSPYLLSIHHVGIERGELFYIMEAADPLAADSAVYIADTLGMRLKSRGRIDPGEALEIVRKIASAVEVLHRAGLIHRDIKPDNIVFVGGEPKLSDPGLMRSIECSATIAGTFGFLPPECINEEEPNSCAGDVYALGKVFYCLISGEKPGHFPRMPRDLPAAVCRKLLPVFLRACNVKREKRCTDITEFRRALPDHLPGPGAWERFAESFRIWRLMHRGLWYALLLALIATASGGGTFGWQMRKRRIRAEALRREAAAELAALRKGVDDGGVLLRLQLERIVGADETKRLLDAVGHLPSKPEAALAACGAIRDAFRQAALCNAAAAKKNSDVLRRSGEIRSLLASPLGAYLAEEERRRIRQENIADERRHLPHKLWKPYPGEVFFSNSARVFDFAYVPPGEFISPRTGEKKRIDYPMWVGRTELTVRQFSALTYYRPAGNRGQENPVNGIVWNDMLAGCLNFPLLESLPPGYIVRPLTEDEWEYCALGGMHKAPETEEWTKERDKREAQRVASFSANFFGLYDMLGNVNEMVLSAKCSRPGSYVVRGGDFMTERSRALTGRKEVAFYQAWMPTTGVRLAVAPGTPEVLKHEIRTGEACHLVVNGRHYEFFGHFLANFDRNRAEKLCMLLGGHLAILDPPEVWQEIRRRSSPVVSYPVVVGAEFRDGCWRWRDGRPVEGAPRQLSKQGGALLLLEGKYTLQSFSRCCGFVCEWSEEEWRLRGEWRSRTRGKQLLHEFRMGDREYALFAACQCCPHLMRRFAEILGGRLAEPETPEDRRRLAAELRAFEDLPILLGGIRLPEGFRWLTDGRRIEGTLMQEGILYDQARSLDAPALLKGRLCAIQSSARLLVEFPASAPTRR